MRDVRITFGGQKLTFRDMFSGIVSIISHCCWCSLRSVHVLKPQSFFRCCLSLSKKRLLTNENGCKSIFFYVLYKMNKSNNLSVSVKWIVYFLSVAVVCFGLLLVLFFYIFSFVWENVLQFLWLNKFFCSRFYYVYKNGSINQECDECIFSRLRMWFDCVFCLQLPARRDIWLLWVREREREKTMHRVEVFNDTQWNVLPFKIEVIKCHIFSKWLSVE